MDGTLRIASTLRLGEELQSIKRDEDLMPDPGECPAGVRSYDPVVDQDYGTEVTRTVAKRQLTRVRIGDYR